MGPRETSTIAAISTPPSAGGVGILRLSGPRALEAARPLAQGLPSEPRPRYAYFTDFADARGQVLDQGLFLYFQGPASFTGEDVVELQAHGSPRLLQLLLDEVLRGGEIRLAEPGEFTKRAFLNGKLDLSRAEAVADLVGAESEAAVRAAASLARGALSEEVKAVRAPLLELRADLEAFLDFPEEGEGAELGAVERLAALRAAASALLERSMRARLATRGARVVLFGPVNAGKSTLFNRLVGAERALVDDEPGTTRDVLEARVEWEGLGVTLADTAGLRDGASRVEAMGIERAKEALAGASLGLLVVPPEASAEEQAQWAAQAPPATPVIAVWSKGDLRAAAPERRLVSGALPVVSGRTGEGVDALRSVLLERLWKEGVPVGVAASVDRHSDALRRSVEALDRASGAAQAEALEVVAGELGLAVEALGEITGESAPRELIDAIFRRFCIGK